MQVIKRNGKSESVLFDKITSRIRCLCYNLDTNIIDPIAISQKVCSRMYNNITTTELDELASELCSELITTHPDYGTLAMRISVSNLHKNTNKLFSDVIEILCNNKDKNNDPAPLISDEVRDIVQKNKDLIDSNIIHSRDFNINYFGYKTLQRNYLLNISGKTIERPQHMFMRVALGIHKNDIEKALETYTLMSERYFIHATPTLFHSGTPRPQFSSCFLLGSEDSIEGIYKNITDCAKISKWAGGIGIHVSNIRSKNSLIRGTGGKSNGIIPMLQVYNNTARYVNQSGRRNGSIAVYLEPWHADVYDFLEAKKNHGSETNKARDLFYAMWIPDLFMERIKSDSNWTLMCPDECPGLADVYGDNFNRLYESYEKKGIFKKQVKARDLWANILSSQIETGTPYMLYKDACNNKSNQKNLGTIKSSNLCCEIIEYSDNKEYACCNLASIGLPSYLKNKETETIVVYSKEGCKYCRMIDRYLNKMNYKFEKVMISNEEKDEFFEKNGIEKRTFPQIFIDNNRIGGYNETKKYLRPEFDFQKLEEIVGILVCNLNKIIDGSFYPVPETKTSNFRHRPIAIGVQGLADVYALSGLPFESPGASQLNKNIFETIYYAALKKSLELAKENGPYETFKGSPLSEGKFQFDLWGQSPSDRYPWEDLRKEIVEHGVRNSLLVAPMPTASTSQILGFNECIEPYTSNIYVRRTLAGEYTIINQHLISELMEQELWSQELKDIIIYYDGSIQKIKEIPDDIKAIYKTVWEITQKVLIDQAADRGIYIDQSQSLNIFIENPTIKNLSSMHFYGWSKGLKTGSYYIRSKPASQSQKFSLDVKTIKKIESDETQENGICEMCSG